MNLKKEELEKHYRDIASLYDMAEELASTVESEFVTDQESQLMLVEPLISNVADAADILSEEFISVLEKPTRVSSAKGKVEGALRKLFMALENYRAQVGLRSKKTMDGLLNIADPIADKIRKQAEKIILAFMQLMELSLDRIMHKFEIEEFKRANDRFISTLPMLGH